jgi:hypothetical protein
MHRHARYNNSPDRELRMDAAGKKPHEIMLRMAARGRRVRAGEGGMCEGGTWRRESFRLPRVDAREKAREWFDRFPKAAYMTEIEFWRELDNDMIEFTIRRLPSAD